MIRSLSALIRLAASISSGTAARSWSMSERIASRSTRTLRVVGTPVPVAICDSSRSIRNMMSTGIGLWHAWLPEQRPERGQRGRRDHARDVAAEARDLLHEARADVAVLHRRHEEDRVDLVGEDAVVGRELPLRLEVRDGSQAADDPARAVGPGGVDRQAVE